MNLSSGGHSNGKHFSDGVCSSAPNKRKRASVTPICSKHPLKKNTNDGGNTPLDCILNEIDAFGGMNAKKREKVKREQRSDEDNGPSTSTSKQPLPPTPVPSSYKALTRSELARTEEDGVMIRNFLRKDGLMERILGYKMMRGRVESYATVRMIVDLDNSISPEYEITDNFLDNKLQSSSVEKQDKNIYKNKPKIHRVNEEIILSEKKHLQRPLDFSIKLEKEPEKRGPKTPPGSPGAHQERSASYCSSAQTVSSSSSPPPPPPPPPPPLLSESAALMLTENNESYNFTRQANIEKDRLNHKPSCTPLPPPPVLPDFDTMVHCKEEKLKIKKEIIHKKQTENNQTEKEAPVQELLRHFSTVTNTPISQLTEYIGEDLQNAMNRLDRKVLLSTLKNALRNVTADTAMPLPISHNSSSNNNGNSQFSSKEVKLENGIDYTKKKNKFQNNNNRVGKQRSLNVIEHHNNVSGAKQWNCNSSAQPISLTSLSQVSSMGTSLPPPPSFLLSSTSSTSQLPKVNVLNAIKTMPAVNLCVPPPPIFLSPSSTTLQTVQSNTTINSPYTTNIPPPMVLNMPIPPPLLQPTLISSNTNLSQISTTPTNVFSSSCTTTPTRLSSGICMSRPPPQIVKVDLTKPQSNIVSQQKPQASKSIINLSAMLNNNKPNNINNRTPRSNITSNSSNRQIQRSRPTPSVDMDFIKSRPPPPIPEILRKSMNNSNTSGANPTISSPVGMPTSNIENSQIRLYPKSNVLAHDLTIPPPPVNITSNSSSDSKSVNYIQQAPQLVLTPNISDNSPKT